VADVERVLAAQNDGWTDLLTTDRTAENPPAPADDAERPVDDAEPPAGAEPLAADAAPTPP